MAKGSKIRSRKGYTTCKWLYIADLTMINHDLPIACTPCLDKARLVPLNVKSLGTEPEAESQTNITWT